MTKRISLLAMLGALALLAWALPPAAVQASDDEATVTGCLNPGEGDGWFVLTPEGGGDEVHVAGGDDVKAHSGNHKVKLTGKWVESEGHKHFEATGVEHIGVCE
jgi:ABC-type sugar transport system substrate-binding protein